MPHYIDQSKKNYSPSYFLAVKKIHLERHILSFARNKFCYFQTVYFYIAVIQRCSQDLMLGLCETGEKHCFKLDAICLIYLHSFFKKTCKILLSSSCSRTNISNVICAVWWTRATLTVKLTTTDCFSHKTVSAQLPAPLSSGYSALQLAPKERTLWEAGFSQSEAACLLGCRTALRLIIQS